MLSVEQRNDLNDLIFSEMKIAGFPKVRYSYSELEQDFKNVQKSVVRFNNNILTNYINAGHKIRSHSSMANTKLTGPCFLVPCAV